MSYFELVSFFLIIFSHLLNILDEGQTKKGYTSELSNVESSSDICFLVDFDDTRTISKVTEGVN